MLDLFMVQASSFAGSIDSLVWLVTFIVGIWFSYALFMRGDTYEEKVARLLPPGFKPQRVRVTLQGSGNTVDQVFAWDARKVPGE